MGYFNFYILKRIFYNLSSFFRKHKIITLFLVSFIIFGLKKCFAAEYTISQQQINKAESLLDSTYTRYSCHMYSNRKVIYLIGNQQTGIWANNTVIQAVQNLTVAWKCYWYDDSTDTATLFWSGVNTGHGSQDMTHMVANFNVYDSSDMSGGYYYVYVPPVTYVQPSFITTSSEISDITNLQYLEIDPGSFTNHITLSLYNATTADKLFQTSLNNFDDYIEREDLDDPFSDLIYRIPVSALPGFSLNKNDDYYFNLAYNNENNVLSNVSLFFSVSSNEVINDATNTDITNKLDETNQKLDETNQQLQDLNDNITSDDISSVSASDLPSVSVNDPTENGIGNIFQNMYNAFCTGQARDIVFPVPFTNKNFTLPANYIQTMLSQHNASWVLVFIQAFWAYLFGRFIIKDISNKINKIKSGNIDDIQSDNIKEEML